MFGVEIRRDDAYKTTPIMKRRPEVRERAASKFRRRPEKSRQAADTTVLITLPLRLGQVNLPLLTRAVQMNDMSQSAPLAYSASDLARLLGISVRSVRRLDAAGKIPRAVHFGRAKRWISAVIHSWIEDGCPPRSEREGQAHPARRVPA